MNWITASSAKTRHGLLAWRSVTESSSVSVIERSLCRLGASLIHAGKPRHHVFA